MKEAAASPAAGGENPEPQANPFAPRLRDLRAEDRLRGLPALDGLPGKFILREGRRCLNLSSNDYLGLAGHPQVRQAAADAALSHGAGAGGSRLLGGGLALLRDLEADIERYRPLGKALLFNTGFMANLGVIQSLAPLLGTVFSDKLNHASVAEALRASPETFHRYRHRDMAHLESLLSARQGGKPGLVVSETLFSMDGDLAPLRALLDLQARFGFYLYLDEAHSTGCLPGIAAVADDERNSDRRVLILATLVEPGGGGGP
jgi:7-keto-8-aminopelargonate synthetase-like enzyme